MRHFLAATVIAALCAATPALSQTSAKPETNCNTPSNTTTGAAGKTVDSMPIGSSAIVPEAGGEKHSAAPTVQQDGKAMEVRKDCPPPTKSKE